MVDVAGGGDDVHVTPRGASARTSRTACEHQVVVLRRDAAQVEQAPAALDAGDDGRVTAAQRLGVPVGQRDGPARQRQARGSPATDGAV